MIHEKSCGAVVFTRQNDQVKYLLVRQRKGQYGFPKGHMEGCETEHETALREIYEEVGLRPRFIDGFRTIDAYNIPTRHNIPKLVVYFLAQYEDQEIVIQESELTGAVLLPYQDAVARLDYHNTRRVLTEAHDFLLRQDSGR